jgi:hypothetical protein
MTTDTTTTNFADNSATIDIDADHGERRLRRVLMIIGGLWLALTPAVAIALPGIAFFHYAWLALLLANLAVWPVVMLAGAAVELRKGVRDARTAFAVRKAERDLDAPAESRLALD